MTVPGKTVFDAALSPLSRGINLVEASAGTGKTYTIAMLVLRLIAESSLKIDEILLVTFTRAATEELGERIRNRLMEARDVLQGCGETDPTLQRWADGVKNREAVCAKIRKALVDIDRAYIFTIHGFCQRTLQDQALESGQLYDVELLPDLSAVKRAVSDDYWRQKMYVLDKRLCSLVLACHSSPEKLLASTGTASLDFSHIDPQTLPLDKAGQKFEGCFKNLAVWWAEKEADYRCRFSLLVAEGKVKKEFTESFEEWWVSLDNYFRGKSFLHPANIGWLSREGFKLQINGSRVRGRKKDELLSELALPDKLCENLLDSSGGFLMSLRGDFARFLKAETEKRMLEKNVMSYDDLIIRLHRAVTAPHGERICRLLAEQFKAVLIDEFQDTDIQQWQIFRKLFGKDKHYLYLIGDPKQAIYRFRGADIHSYFLARESASSQLTLEKNYRSHPSMITAVNYLFSQGRDPFYYSEDTLSFHPVSPALSPDNGCLEFEGEDIAGMVYCHLPTNSSKENGRWGTGEAASAILKYVVSEIIRLLQGGAELYDGNERRELRPGDIAVLVRNNSHAEEYQQELRLLNVPAVISSKTSVFHTEECSELLTLLKAAAQPGNTDLLKRCMTITWLGYTGNQLHQIWNNEAQFDQHHSQFAELSLTWQERGVLVMMNSLLDQENVYGNLSSLPGFERKIANIKHLLELTRQAEADNMFGPLQVIQWLQQQMESSASDNELRLEKDEEAVSIVTMHGAKGLEYPVVFCPYLWYRKTRAKGEHPGIICYEKGRRILDLGSELYEGRLAQAESEEMAEDVRLLYVAVTRAKIQCYVFWCDIAGRRGGPSGSFDSPLGYLLFRGTQMGWAEQSELLQKIAEDSSSKYILLPELSGIPVQVSANRPQHHLLVKRLGRQSLHTDFQMTSYSSLSSSYEHTSFVYKKEGFNEESQANLDYASLPAGANFGNVVHDILETAAFSGLVQPHTHSDLLREICEKYGVEADIALLEKMFSSMVSAPIRTRKDTAAFTLAGLAAEKCLKEMGFYFRLKKSHTNAVNTILKSEKTFVPLKARQLEGYLTGFVDLIFIHENRYYIADYKTNNLGDTSACYENEKLVEAMLSHNYGLQLWLYSLVLHNYLKSSLPGYDFDIHFGGVCYLFVRGMDNSGRGVYYHCPSFETLASLEKCFGDE